jgi:hypothetical protein
MRLYVDTMDAVLIDVDRDNGQVLFEGEDWYEPTLQERRAIVYAAEREQEALREVIDCLSGPSLARDR